MKKKTKVILLFSIVVIVVILLMSFFAWKKDQEYKNKIIAEKKLVKRIKLHYGEYVKVTKNSLLYKKINGKYVKIGLVYKNKELSLDNQVINKNTKYFKIKELNYYIKYQDVSKIDNISELDTRYKSYIPFNENIVTKDKVRLYKDNKVIYILNYSLDLPIIRKSDIGRYVEFHDELYLVKNEDIDKIYERQNNNLETATSIAVTVYHFIYLEGDKSCNEEICHSESSIRDNFNYLKENKFFTINTKEMEWFIDGDIRLPKKSILVTIDDGARAENFIPLLEEYNINATLFLVSSWYPKEKFDSKYLELASHTHNLHNPGKCPGGQGSPLKCMEKEKLLEDLKLSRQTLDNTEAFCYPFYEFNDYSESILKEAGFKTAYIGGMKKVVPGINKYRIPRISLHKNTTLNEYIRYIN